jgi:hypothetical protein
VNNGWDTDFMERFIAGQNKAAKDGTLNTYFESDKATGVVTWDHEGSNGNTFKFGDIYDNGTKVGNVYDLYDRETADLRMVPLLFDGKEQGRLFQDSDRQTAIKNAVASRRDENNVEIPKALTAKDFAQDVEKTQDSLDEGLWSEVVGTVAAAGSGALMGSGFGPWGTAIGAVAGGVGFLVNQDDLENKAARAVEITKQNAEENNKLSATFTGIGQAGKLAMQAGSPFQNLAKGAYDAKEGDIGDDTAEFYELNKDGTAKPGAFWQGLNLGAAVIDGVLQFGSGRARALYATEMGLSIGGDVGELLTNGGEAFNPRSGTYDPLFLDDEGKFDPVSGAAGILNIGVDAVQLGGLSGIARATRANRTALDEGEQIAEAAGHRFVVDDLGRAVEGKAKKTMAILAPSEQVAWASATRAARVNALKEGRAVTTDDFYQAAMRMASGDKRLKAAVLNGFGEGYEEAVQSLLEPISMDGELSFSEVANSFLLGAASGVGMTAGATRGAPTQDERLYSRAQIMHFARYGTHLSKADWDGLTETEKRSRSAMNKTDIDTTRGALKRIASDQAAERIASEPDAAKALDARRGIVEKELRKATERTDSYTVISGIIDQKDVGRAEAVEGSALKVLQLLEDRAKGIGLQEQYLTRREAELQDQDQSNLDVARELANTQELLTQIKMVNLVINGNEETQTPGLLDFLAEHVAFIYDPATTAQDAQARLTEFNVTLEQMFDRSFHFDGQQLNELGLRAADAKMAAAKFVSLLHSREPKLDAGSYHSLLPQADWELTRTRSDNFLKVNMDYLQSINGDFDGDKLRAENQLILNDQQFSTSRAGSNFGGVGQNIDIATRNFDKALTEALGDSLNGGNAWLELEAAGALREIRLALIGRYGQFMSPAQLNSIFRQFETSVRAGKEEARVELINALAKTAGEQIDRLGRDQLTNEWLWISKVVRYNFQEFQRSFWRLRTPLAAGGPTETEVSGEETPRGTQILKTAASTEAQTLALFVPGNSLFRKFQSIHYTFFNSSVLSADGTELVDLYDMAEFYAELSRGVTQSELQRVTANDSIAARALTMLERLAKDAMKDPDIRRKIDGSTAMSVLANVKVKDVWWGADGTPQTDGQTISLAQLLLKRALEAERTEAARVFANDMTMQARHNRLIPMTLPGDVNAERAFIEIFKAAPFAESVGLNLGNLSPHVTPEQWLQAYIAQDDEGRREMKRFYTNHPAYLDRKETTNLPYSLSEVGRQEVTAYRSMMDALLAVGNASIVFNPDAKDPADALSGDLVKPSQRAQGDFKEAFTLLREAMESFRTISNRKRGRRSNADLAQEMLQNNPLVGRQLLEAIPDAAANALFEYRDGQLYVSNWLYDMFEIENADEALMYYWKNLTLAKWNATQVNVREDDGGGTPGRVYDRLQSRFQRLLFELSQEPGQRTLELVVRQMDSIKNLDEFFVWLNSAPGVRNNRIIGEQGNRAPLVPFNDDVSAFEADVAGGWVTARADADLRESLAMLRQSAEYLRDSMKFQAESDATDSVRSTNIRRALLNNPDDPPTSEDLEDLRKFRRAMSMAINIPRGFSPRAMLALTRGVVTGFDAHSTDKGQTPTSYEAYGELQMLMDAFGFLPNFEQLQESLTSHSLSSLSTDIGNLIRTSGQSMDAYGRPIEWEGFDPNQDSSLLEMLDMLDDWESKPLALALMTPKAMDVTAAGKLQERLMFESSLSTLLDNTEYERFYQYDDADEMSLSRDMNYLMALDARANQAGGSFSAMRLANDLAITMTSALDHPATIEDSKRLSAQAYRAVAKIMRLVGEVQSNVDTRSAGLLSQLKDYAVEQMQRFTLDRKLPEFRGLDKAVVQEWIQGLLAQLAAEQATIIDGYSSLYSGDELDRRIEALDEQYALNAELIQGMLDNNQALQLVQRFHLTGDEQVDAAARANIIEYVSSMTSFPTRAPEAADAWAVLQQQRKAGRIDLKPEQWDVLSRGAMGVQLADKAIGVASHISTPPFPKGDPLESSHQFFKYLDTSFSYLAEDLLSDTSPLAEAAVWMHGMARQPSPPVVLDDAVRVLNTTLLRPEQYGSWTPGLMSQLVATQERMDSSAAPGGIAANGNGPKRWAIPAFATRRTFKTEGLDQLLTTATLSWADIKEDASQFNDIIVTPAGSPTPRPMPVAQLNNRFVHKLRINGEEVPLYVGNLGFELESGPNVDLAYITVSRLRAAVERRAARLGVPVESLQIELDFLHPDSQPEGEGWYHNVYFEGMNHDLLPDTAESLIASIWMDNGGLVAEGTQALLDAGKSGKPAKSRFKHPNPVRLAEAHAAWITERDFAKMLRIKTELWMTTDQGNGGIDPAAYNAIYKMLKLQHIVVGTVNGERVAFTAEEVIAFQLEHPDDPLSVERNGEFVPVENVELRTLSMDVLRSMLGDTGNQGVQRFFQDELLINPDLVPAFTGITDTMLGMFGDGWFSQPGRIQNTPLSHVGHQRVLGIGTAMTDKERSARDERIRVLEEQRARVHSARVEARHRDDFRQSYARVLDLAGVAVDAERLDVSFGAIPGVIAPRNMEAVRHTQRILQALHQTVTPGNDYRRGWQVVDEAASNFAGGMITVEALSGGKRAKYDNVVKDDVALVQLDTFQKPERDPDAVQERVEKSLRYLIDSGATIILGSNNGAADLRAESARYLLARGYIALKGSKHVYVPSETSGLTQNERAYESTFLETQRISPVKNIVTALAIDPIGTDENAAIRNANSVKLRDRKAVTDILPSRMYNGFDILLDDGRRDGLHARAHAHLLSMLDPANAEARAALLKMAGPDLPRVKSIEQSLNDFHSKISRRNSLRPETGDVIERGDIIPFVHSDGRIILYRHGLKAPRIADLPDLLSENNGMNIALGQSKAEPLSTDHSGVIHDVRNEAGFGRRLEIHTELQEYGDKIQLEWNGMKYVVVPMPELLQDYSWDVFSNGTMVDLISDVLSADSKEAFSGRINNYRNALAFFEFNFLDDMVEFFYPGISKGSKEWPGAVTVTNTLLHKLARQDDVRIPYSTARSIARANVEIGDLLGQFAAAQASAGGPKPAWARNLQVADTANAQIARAVITYLLTPQANPENILRSAGFAGPNALNEDGTTRLVPGLFADLLDGPADGPLHTELIRRFDAQLQKNPDGSGMRLHNNWQVEVFKPGGADPIRVYLQFGEAHSSGDNPLLDGQAYDFNEAGAVSAHNALAAAMSTGALAVHKRLDKSRAFAKSFERGTIVEKFSDDGANAWEMLTRLPAKDASQTGWRQETQAESARRMYAREEISGLFKRLNRKGWTKEQKRDYRSIMSQVMGELNLFGNQNQMFDTWVRMMLGKPWGMDDKIGELGIISGARAVEIAQEIRINIRNNDYPTAGGRIPLMDNNHVSAIYMANAHRSGGWAPRTEKSNDASADPKAASWDAWIETAFGTAWGEDRNPRFDPVYLLAVDGLMHGYQGATSNLRALPVSSDLLKQNLLMDPETNRMLISISADVNLLTTELDLFGSSKAQLEDIVIGSRIYSSIRGENDPNSAQGWQDRQLANWRAEGDAPVPGQRQMRGVRAPGQTFIGHSTKTTALFRSLLNLRVGNAMFNAALVISAPIQAFVMRTLNMFANVAVGESTGRVGQAQMKLAERFSDTSIAAIANELGFTLTYESTEQLKQVNDLVNALSSRSEFRAMVYKELMYQYPSMPGIGKIEKWLERYAKWGARLQDPSWGMMPRDLARIYMETVMRKIAADPIGENIYSIDMLIAQMQRNPEWIYQQDREAHNMAIASIAQTRNLKPSILSLAVRGVIEPLSENDSPMWNATGNLMKMLAAFQNFWANYSISITGMQGPADFAAALFDGREKKIVKRMQSALRGEPYDPENKEYYDMSEVLEGLDLADSFIRGGITHTMLFQFGLIAGGLGLSGEDEEEKYRRRAAELQGAGFVHDPRKLQNDFANRDAIFLDWLPFGLDSYFKVPDGEGGTRAVGQMNWILRTFLSPVIGFERFYETGNFMEVYHGFKDAIGSHPLVNAQLWEAWSDTVAELHNQAVSEAEKGTPESMAASAHLLTTAVGILDRMLMENAMVNMIYVGTDQYDRNPWVQPKTSGIRGEMATDAEGNLVPTDNLKEFTGEDGETQVGYVSRNPADAQVRSLTETRFGLALIGSLFTAVSGGGFTGSDMFRQNMVPKIRQFELTPKSDAEIEETLLASFVGLGGAPSLTEEEAVNVLKQQARDAGVRYNLRDVEAAAKQYAESQGLGAMSIINDKGREVPTDEGARATISALAKGEIQLDDAALNGYFLTFEMREALQEKWMKQLVEEGIEMGLTKSMANSRMKRLWFGPLDDPEQKGLYDFVWSKEIPFSDTLEYTQLNTTYMMGPDGWPRATGFTRDGIMGALGIKMLNRPYQEADTGLELDERMNVVDGPAGINTGMRAIKRRGENWELPLPEEEIRAAAERVADAIGELDLGSDNGERFASGGYGYGGGGYGGYSGGGGGGGRGGYGPHISPIRFNGFQFQRATFADGIPFINTSNPIIRRASIRRERISSERGRLKQWQ